MTVKFHSKRPEITKKMPIRMKSVLNKKALCLSIVFSLIPQGSEVNDCEFSGTKSVKRGENVTIPITDHGGRPPDILFSRQEGGLPQRICKGGKWQATYICKRDEFVIPMAEKVHSGRYTIEYTDVKDSDPYTCKIYLNVTDLKLWNATKNISNSSIPGPGEDVTSTADQTINYVTPIAIGVAVFVILVVAVMILVTCYFIKKFRPKFCNSKETTADGSKNAMIRSTDENFNGEYSNRIDFTA